MKTKIIHFSSYDGYKLEGTLERADEERAAVLFVHGITSSRDELGFHSDYAEYLARHGVSSLRFDYRFHGSYKATLQDLSLCGIVNDIDSAFEALVSAVRRPTRSFILVGTSFGGGLSAFWANAKRQPPIAKLILNAPVINYENDVLERNKLVSHSHLAPKAVRQLDRHGFVRSSGIKFGRALINELPYINGIAALKALGDRVVIFHGDRDEDVPISSSKQYKSAATSLRVVKGVGHGFGIDIDDDLTHPETKKVHHSIYKAALRIIEAAI